MNASPHATAPARFGGREKPLPPGARSALELAAAGTMLLFYGLALLWMIGLGAGLVILSVATLGAARFGLGGFVGQLMVAPARLLVILGRRLWLPSEVALRITLRPNEAPRLLELSGRLAERIGVAPPRTLVVEGHAGAWVKLHGFRRASGSATLCVGFDLLAGLSVSEVEAVIAHELGHARFVQRGFARWLNKGLARLAAVAQDVSVYAAQRELQGSPSDVARWAKGMFEALTRRAARLIAAYSRQDEFEADRAAAELCGASAIRSSLLKLPALEKAANRLPWHERVARLRSGDPFTPWLVDELSRLGRSGDLGPLEAAVDPYATHPSIHDRVHALPPDDRPLRDTSSATQLLSDADAIARRLVDEIQRVLTIQERAHARKLAKATRKFCRPKSLNLARALGVILLGFGIVLALLLPAYGPQPALLGALLACVGLGLPLYRYSGYRDRRKLPIPAFGSFKTQLPFESDEALAAAEEEIAAALLGETDRLRGKRARVDHLTAASYRALEKPDYLRAHVAARLARQIRGDSVEANLAYAVAAGGLRIPQHVEAALQVVRDRVGLGTLSTKWGAAWALMMLEDWSVEGLLDQLQSLEPSVATYPALKATAQRYCGKAQSAAQSAELALRLDPTNAKIRHLAANTLLETGRAHDAHACAEGLRATARTNPEDAVLLVRTHLMVGNASAAAEWAEVVKGLDDTGCWRISLGRAFAMVRADDQAAKYYGEVVDTKYAPQAHLGLGAIAATTGDRPRARRHLLAALRMKDKSFAFGEGRGDVLHQVIGQLNELEELRVSCQAWTALIPQHAGVLLAGVSLLVYAPTEAAARGHIVELVSAMEDDGSTFDPACVQWLLEPKDRQPLRPVQPGVQGVVA